MKILGVLQVLVAAALLIPFLPACSNTTFTQLELTAYNHTDHGIAEYTVSIPEGKGSSAGFLDSGAGGGGFTCCVSVPTIWKPGMTVAVTSITVENGSEKATTKLVAVPRYDSKTSATMNVHFLRGGAVKVFVTRVMLGHRDYPLSGKEAELKPGVPLKILWP